MEGPLIIYNRCGGSRCDGVAHPSHAGCKGRIGEEFVAGGVVDSFAVVGEELASIEGNAPDAGVTGSVHLSTHFVERPASFAWVEKVDAESWTDGVSVGVLEPVEEERIVIVAREVHHGKEHVLVVFTQPKLGVLPYCIVAVPTTSAVPSGVGILSNGRTAEFHPRLDGFDHIVYTSDDAGDILTSPFSFAHAGSTGIEFVVGVVKGGFRVSDVVE